MKQDKFKVIPVESVIGYYVARLNEATGAYERHLPHEPNLMSKEEAIMCAEECNAMFNYNK